MPGRQDNAATANNETTDPRQELGRGAEHGIPQQQPERGTHPPARRHHSHQEDLGHLASEEASLMNLGFQESGSGYGGTQQEGQSAANDHPGSR